MSCFSADSIAAWSEPSQETIMTLDDAIESFHLFGPRARFLKTLPLNASVLDAGAGDRSSIFYKEWPRPKRADLTMYAWAGQKGENFALFNDHEVGFWPQQPPDFGGRSFDAVFSANFIEHIDDPDVFIRQCVARLNNNGRIYLEWPREESLNLPSKKDLAELDVRVMTGHYHDDGTHRRVPPHLSDVISTLIDSGADIIEQGVASVPMVDQQLAIHARRTNDLVLMTLAYWSVTGWCRYIVAERRCSRQKADSKASRNID